MARILRTVAFLTILIAAYLALLLTFSQVHFDDRPLLLWVARVPKSLSKGGSGQTLRRYRELRSYGRVDVAFVGSSHTYRSFDTRVFEEAGIRSFNMGTTGQTPLNSYWLMREYLAALSPRLVVVEVYWDNFTSRDGLEASYDLLVNLPPSGNLFRMALATHSPYAFHLFAGRRVETELDLVPSAEQAPVAGEAYVPGGYVESQKRSKRAFPVETHVEIQERQLDYLARCLRLVRERGARSLVVVQPVPQELLRSVVGYHEIASRIADVVSDEGVVFRDFNGTLPLDSRLHFMDDDHLNAEGVRIFNAALVPLLREALQESRPEAPAQQYPAKERVDGFAGGGDVQGQPFPLQ